MTASGPSPLPPERPCPIAIDGPVSSGKSSLGARLAGDLGVPFLDTGLLYRAVGLALPPAAADDPGLAADLARALDLAVLDDPRLGGEEAGERASKVAAMPAVRAALLDLQRAFGARPGGAVLAGRDIGSAVFPDAPIKLFVTASAEVRARRRFEQLREQGVEVIEADVLAELRRRDERDRTRATAPLVVPTDAFLLDTSELGFEDAVAAARSFIEDIAARPRR
ncbi:MAG: (d)CMP kinase [Alphaproteobacteria bacterium]|jgi:cytidylate kinase|nr:(d)CMP kinase [Alphaproteobacteria bacterium]